MKRIFQLALLIAMLITAGAAPALAQLSEVSVASNQSVEIDRHGICKVVKNLNPTNALYVPSMSRDEWVNFLSVPPWREVSECVRCSGYARDGYCFYAGVYGESCDAVCSGRGGVEAGGMNRLNERVPTAALPGGVPVDPRLFGGELTLVGGGGAGQTYYCEKVTAALLGPTTDPASLAATGQHNGCVIAYYGARNLNIIDSSWSGGSIYSGNWARRICACNR